MLPAATSRLVDMVNQAAAAMTGGG
jgi:hypothetical protein